MEQYILIKNKKKSLKEDKKAQVWSLDLIIASIIFLIGIVILFYYAINYFPQSKNQLEEFFYEGNLASELILSEEDFGILDNGMINQTKLNNFSSLSSSRKKSILGMKNNFYFVMDDLEDETGFVDYVGIINSSNTESLIKVTRLTVYKNKPTKFELFVWK